MRGRDVAHIIVSVATPYATGSGFVLPGEDLIVTNEHVVRGQSRVAIEGKTLERHLAQVVFTDEVTDVALIRLEKKKEAEAKDFREVPMEQGTRLEAWRLGRYHKLMSEEGEVTEVGRKIDRDRYFVFAGMVEPGYSGGPVTDEDGRLVGMTCFMVGEAQGSTFVLPLKRIQEVVKEAGVSEEGIAARCPSCLKITASIPPGTACSICGSSVHYPDRAEEYEPRGMPRVIEHLLKDLGEDPILCRNGRHQWEVQRGSAMITVSYHEKSGMILGESYLCRLPEDGLNKIYRYLLQQNVHLRGLTFSIRGMDVVLSILIYDHFLDEDASKDLLASLFDRSDHYDNILVEDFGSYWKN
jgi:serine protease Do